MNSQWYDTVMSRSVLGWWRFSDGSGDEYLYGRDAILDPGWDGEGLAEPVTGLMGGDPDGGVRIILGASFGVAHGAWMDTPEFTLEGLFDFDLAPTYGGLFGRMTVGNVGWALVVDGDDLQLVSTTSAGSTPLPLEPTMFALVGGAGTLDLWLQGEKVVSIPYDEAMNNTVERLTFGSPRAGYALNSLPGAIDEFVLYDFRLSQEQIEHDYLLFSTGQNRTVITVQEYESSQYFYPRVGSGVSWRHLLSQQDPWGLWSGPGSHYAGEHGDDGELMRVHDHGPRGHHMSGRPADLWMEDPGATTGQRLGPEVFGNEIISALDSGNALESQGDGHLYRSLETISTSSFTAVILLAVSPWALDPDYFGVGMFPLLTCAVEEGSDQFDKCLYLNEDRQLCWLTGVGGSQELIVDPDPFPADGVTRCVVASVGPAGAKIRVSGTTKVTGSNTTSWTGDQHVFFFSGGQDDDFDFVTLLSTVTTLTSGVAPVLMSPVVFDKQLSDATTDEYWHFAKSYRNVAHMWGGNAISVGLDIAMTSKRFTGEYYRFTDNYLDYQANLPDPPNPGGPDGTYLEISNGVTSYWGVYVPGDDSWLHKPGLAISDPLDRSFDVPDGTNDAGGWGYSKPGIHLGGDVNVSWTIHQDLFHCLAAPTTFAGRQTVWSMKQYYYDHLTGKNTSESPRYELMIVDGYLTVEFWYAGTLPISPYIADTFVHTVPLHAGVNALGLEFVDGAVDLWVNGDKQSFTRTATTFETGFYVGAGEGYLWGYHFGAHTEEDWPNDQIFSQQLTGRASDLILTRGKQTYLKPERFFEDLAWSSQNALMALIDAVEVETAGELTLSLAVADQDISLETAVENEETARLAFGLEMLTAFEEDAATGMALPVELLIEDNGETTIESEDLDFLAAELHLTILEPTVIQAPTSIVVVASGGQAQTPVTFLLDGIEIYTTDLDSTGQLGPTSLNISAAMGTAGTHTLTIYQMANGGATGDSEVFTILLDPALYPEIPGGDGPPVAVPGAVVENVRHWVFQDLLPEVSGGIGSYVLPHNPREMTSPHYEHAMTARATTSRDGVAHIFQAGTLPKEWTFTGYCPDEERQENIEAYRRLNRRFRIIDHHNRAWKVVITNAEFVPRRRQTYNNAVTDWGSDFTITAIVLDQNWETPT